MENITLTKTLQKNGTMLLFSCMKMNLLRLSGIMGLFFGTDYRIERFKTDLPLIYEKAFSLFKLQAVKGASSYALAVPKDEYVPREYLLSISKMLSLRKETPIIVLYGKLDCHKRFAKANLIHFLCDDGDSYLPYEKNRFLVDDSSINVFEQKYTKGTQLVLKYYLFNSSGFYSARDIAKKISMSVANVSRANSFLFAKGVLDRQGVNSGSRFSMPDKAKALKGLDKFLLSPYRKKLLVPVDEAYGRQLMERFLLCGDSALAKYSELSANSDKIELALSQEEYKTLIDVLSKSEPSADLSKMVSIYEFRYDPSLFAKDGCIDLLDLYIMKKESDVSNDPRLKNAINGVKKRMVGHGQ